MIDPYTLPWVQGAAATLPIQTRRKYAAQFTDLVEKLAVLRSKRPKDYEKRLFEARARENESLYGPRPRNWAFQSMEQSPPPDEGRY